MAWIEQCGDNTWRVRYRRDDDTIGAIPGFTTSTAAQDYADDMESEQRRGTWIDPAAGQTTLGEFVDTNVFIRLLARDDPEKTRRCLALLQRAERGEAQLVTSESVVAEVVYVLSSPALRHVSLLRSSRSSPRGPFSHGLCSPSVHASGLRS